MSDVKNKFLSSFLLLTLFISLPTLAEGPSELSSLNEIGKGPKTVSTPFLLKIAEISPTQFDVGSKEIQRRKKITGDLDEKVGKVVKGPGGVYYLIDGHHLTRARHELGHPDVTVTLVHDWSQMTEEKFWEKMTDPSAPLTYLFDATGKKRSYKELPKSIGQLSNDPYRSLAWYVRKAGGFKKGVVPFQEFQWANYFRKKFPNLTDNDIDFHLIAKKAVLLLQSGEARELGLPGARKKDYYEKNCQEIFTKLEALFN